jgi:hypothetical protein
MAMTPHYSDPIQGVASKHQRLTNAGKDLGILSEPARATLFLSPFLISDMAERVQE